VGVGVERDADLRVAKAFLDHLGMDAGGQQERSRGVPQVVEADGGRTAVTSNRSGNEENRLPQASQGVTIISCVRATPPHSPRESFMTYLRRGGLGLAFRAPIRDLARGSSVRYARCATLSPRWPPSAEMEDLF